MAMGGGGLMQIFVLIIVIINTCFACAVLGCMAKQMSNCEKNTYRITLFGNRERVGGCNGGYIAVWALLFVVCMVQVLIGWFWVCYDGFLWALIHTILAAGMIALGATLLAKYRETGYSHKINKGIGATAVALNALFFVFGIVYMVLGGGGR